MAKKVIERLIIIGFILFFCGGLAMVLLQMIGLVLLKPELVVWAKNSFTWIFTMATLTGMAAYLYSYIVRKE